MGITSENVAERYCVTREDQDMAAVCFSFPLVTYSCLLYSHTDSVKKQVESHKRAAAANASGKLKDEIVPVATKVETRSSKLPCLVRAFSINNCS